MQSHDRESIIRQAQALRYDLRSYLRTHVGNFTDNEDIADRGFAEDVSILEENLCVFLQGNL
ncbi:MAG: hypothetical protein MN733_20645 [Nitrososphaera sp.]|nr:hypothetical protein [Nitrososphaera sp.]